MRGNSRRHKSELNWTKNRLANLRWEGGEGGKGRERKEGGKEGRKEGGKEGWKVDGKEGREKRKGGSVVKGEDNLEGSKRMDGYSLINEEWIGGEAGEGSCLCHCLLFVKKGMIMGV